MDTSIYSFHVPLLRIRSNTEPPGTALAGQLQVLSHGIWMEPHVSRRNTQRACVQVFDES